MQLISGGLYVTRILQKPEGLGELLPERLLTLSPCLTEFLPDSWAFDWASFADFERVAALAKLGLTAELLPLIRRSVDAAFAAGERFPGRLSQIVRHGEDVPRFVAAIPGDKT